MGIPGLLQALKGSVDHVSLSRFRGKTAAVDTLCWLHKGVYSCCTELCTGVPTRSHIHFCLDRIAMLLRNGIRPLMVFDGARLPSKSDTEAERHRRRSRNLAKGRAYLEAGNRAAAHSCFTKAVDVTPEMCNDLVAVLRLHGIEYVVAPYEADAQLAYLARQGIADLIISEDSDCIPYGCDMVLFKLGKEGCGELIRWRNVVSSDGQLDLVDFTRDQFLFMCILTGCDYLPSLPGMGIKTAHRIARQCHSTDDVLRQLRRSRHVPPGYAENFERARLTFRHQLVFCPRRRQTVPLTPLAKGLTPAQLPFIGAPRPRPLAIAIATSTVHPDTHIAFPDVVVHKSTRSRLAPFFHRLKPQAHKPHQRGLNKDVGGAQPATASSSHGNGAGNRRDTSPVAPSPASAWPGRLRTASAPQPAQLDGASRANPAAARAQSAITAFFGRRAARPTATAGLSLKTPSQGPQAPVVRCGYSRYSHAVPGPSGSRMQRMQRAPSVARSQSTGTAAQAGARRTRTTTDPAAVRRDQAVVRRSRTASARLLSPSPRHSVPRSASRRAAAAPRVVASPYFGKPQPVQGSVQGSQTVAQVQTSHESPARTSSKSATHALRRPGTAPPPGKRSEPAAGPAWSPTAVTEVAEGGESGMEVAEGGESGMIPEPGACALRPVSTSPEEPSPTVDVELRRPALLAGTVWVPYNSHGASHGGVTVHGGSVGRGKPLNTCQPAPASASSTSAAPAAPASAARASAARTGAARLQRRRSLLTHKPARLLRRRSSLSLCPRPWHATTSAPPLPSPCASEPPNRVDCHVSRSRRKSLALRLDAFVFSGGRAPGTTATRPQESGQRFTLRHGSRVSGLSRRDGVSSGPQGCTRSGRLPARPATATKRSVVTGSDRADDAEAPEAIRPQKRLRCS